MTPSDMRSTKTLRALQLDCVEECVPDGGDQSHPLGNLISDQHRGIFQIYRGRPVESTLWRTFGGQVVAQALTSALRSVHESFAPQSLHAYFLAPGNPTIDTTYEVEKLRDGRGFCFRSVRAYQDRLDADGQPTGLRRLIFTLQCSFKKPGDVGPDHGVRPPAVFFAGPESVESDFSRLTPEFVQLLLHEWTDWDIRILPKQQPDDDNLQAWIRYKGPRPAGDFHYFDEMALAYCSDMTVLQSGFVRAVEAAEHPEALNVDKASWDHAVWFQRPINVGEWLFLDKRSPTGFGARVFTEGRFYDAQGNMVAVVTQEGLGRYT